MPESTSLISFNDLRPKFGVPLGDATASWMAENYGAGQSWVDLGTYADANGNKNMYGFAFKMDLKSLVWYSPEQFEDNGYEIPTTMEDLIALSDQMVADGNTPWCIGVESGNATGWTATDWMEDLMLRTTSPENYDRWVSNDLPFNSPEVLNAMEVYGQFSRNDDYVAGGAASVATTFFGDAPKGLFTSPASCMMHRQASFIPAFFPKKGEEVANGEADFFYFPPYASKDLGNPVLGAGTLWTMTKDSPATRAFFEFMKEPSAHEAWMSQGTFLTAHKGVNLATTRMLLALLGCWLAKLLWLPLVWTCPTCRSLLTALRTRFFPMTPSLLASTLLSIAARLVALAPSVTPTT